MVEGMTDLQYKSFLKRIVAEVEQAMAEDTRESENEKLKALLEDLRADIESC